MAGAAHYRTTAVTEDRVRLIVKEEVEPLHIRINQLDQQLAFIKGKFEGWGGNLTGKQKTFVSGVSIAAVLELFAIILKFGGV